MDAATEFCPIDIQDVCECVSALVLDETATEILEALDDQHVGQVYTLTGAQMLDGKQLMQSLIDATHYSAFRYTHIRPMDLQYYLQFLQNDILFDARLKKDRSRIIGDDFTSHAYRLTITKAPSRSGKKKMLLSGTFFLGNQLTLHCSFVDLQIQDFLDYFDWVARTSSSIDVPHVRLLTGKPPRSLEAFFLENANAFKPRG
jgi:hypothetical protein